MAKAKNLFEEIFKNSQASERKKKSELAGILEIKIKDNYTKKEMLENLISVHKLHTAITKGLIETIELSAEKFYKQTGTVLEAVGDALDNFNEALQESVEEIVKNEDEDEN